MKLSKISIDDEPYNLPYLYELRSDLQKAIWMNPKNIDLKNYNTILEETIAFRERNTELLSTERISILTTVSSINGLITGSRISDQIYHSPTDSSESYHNNLYDIPVSTQHCSCFAVILFYLLGVSNHHSDI